MCVLNWWRHDDAKVRGKCCNSRGTRSTVLCGFGLLHLTGALCFFMLRAVQAVPVSTFVGFHSAQCHKSNLTEGPKSQESWDNTFVAVREARILAHWWI